MQLSIVVEQKSDFLHLKVLVTAVLIAKKTVQCSQLIKAKYTFSI